VIPEAARADGVIPAAARADIVIPAAARAEVAAIPTRHPRAARRNSMVPHAYTQLRGASSVLRRWQTGLQPIELSLFLHFAFR
jgi:hypothetical protein